MNKFLLYIFICVSLASCELNKEEDLNTDDDRLWISSYIIDGIKYEKKTYLGWYNAGSDIYHPFTKYDSAFYWASSSLYDGKMYTNFSVVINKRFHTDQMMAKTSDGEHVFTYSLFQEDMDKFFNERFYPFSFNRSFSEGVALSLPFVDKDGTRRILNSFSTAPSGGETIFDADFQAGSNFEIIKVGVNSVGETYIEVRFNVTVLEDESTGKAAYKKKVTNGFARFPVSLLN